MATAWMIKDSIIKGMDTFSSFFFRKILTVLTGAVFDWSCFQQFSSTIKEWSWLLWLTYFFYFLKFTGSFDFVKWGLDWIHSFIFLQQIARGISSRHWRFCAKSSPRMTASWRVHMYAAPEGCVALSVWAIMEFQVVTVHTSLTCCSIACQKSATAAAASTADCRPPSTVFLPRP